LEKVSHMAATRAQYVLAVDLGTSGPKVALVSTRGEIVDVAFEAVELLLLPNGGAEQRPEEWWQAVLRASRAVLQRQSDLIEHIVAIGCTGQWSGTVAIGKDGRHLMNAIIWLDARGAPLIRDITRGWLQVEGYALRKLQRWIRLTGGAPNQSGKDPLAHILYIKNCLPDIYARTHKFLEPVDYLTYQWTGQIAASFSSMALHWVTDNRHIDTIRYNDGLLQMAGIAKAKLPELHAPGSILGPIKGDVAHALGLPPSVPVVVATPDVPCAAVGSGAVDDFQGHLYIGTSAWLTCHVPYKKTDLLHGMAALPAGVPGKYFVANEQETAGACLNFLKHNVLYGRDELPTGTPPDDFHRVWDQMVAEVPAGSQGVLFTPWLYGERTPVEDHSLRGGLLNLSLTTTRAQIMRAVYEGVAFNVKWLLRYVEKFIRRPLNPIYMIGGGGNSDVWCQIHADVLNRTIQQVQDPILANLRGAAFLAAAALGVLRYEEIPPLVPIARQYHPNPAHRAVYQELFKAFLTVYRSTRKIYARLNPAARPQRRDTASA
jgi:xylulokinase